jgi:hypothetical protein
LDSINQSLYLFNKGYLDQDELNGLIDKETKEKVKIDLMNIIYYNGNYIYNQIMIDLYLMRNSKLRYYLIFIPKYIKKIINKYL